MSADYIAIAIGAVILAGVLFLLLKGEKPNKRKDTDPRGSPDDPEAWEIGPIVGSMGNFSKNLPLRPKKDADGWLYFDMEPNSSEPHYVTFRHGPLTGKTQLVMHCKIEGEGKLVGAGDGGASGVTLYFARIENNWMGDGLRWWASRMMQPVKDLPAEFESTARLDGFWGSVIQWTTDNAPVLFNESIGKADRVGFTFANAEGFGHGCVSTSRVRFKWRFTVE